MNYRSSASVVVAALMMLCCSAGEAPRPNLILISIDTLRADRMSLSGYARETTPEIDDLGSDAVVFDAFFNAYLE